MICILSLFMVVVSLVMPLFIFSLKLRQDKTLSAVVDIEKRLAAIEERLAELHPARQSAVVEVAPEHGDSCNIEGPA